MDAHIEKVVQVLVDFQDEIIAMVGRDIFVYLVIAAYLHDAVEDTYATIRQIARLFGIEVARLVWAVTGCGETRVIRNADMKRKIMKHVLAAILKLADRIANVEGSTSGSKHHGMYRKELSSFETYIRPHVPPAMWDRLVRAFD